MVPVTQAVARPKLIRGAAFALILTPLALLGACAQQPPPPPTPVYVAPPPPAPMAVPPARG